MHLIFLRRLSVLLTTRQPTAARPIPSAGASYGPIGSHGAPYFGGIAGLPMGERGHHGIN
jgi:hypothetical protein